MALSNPPRLQKVVDVRRIPWRKLAFQSDGDLTIGKVSMTSLSTIVMDQNSQSIGNMMVIHPETFKDSLMSLGKHQKNVVMCSRFSAFKTVDSRVVSKSVTYPKTIRSLQLCDFDNDSFIESKELLIQLLKLCSGLEVYYQGVNSDKECTA